MSKPQWIVNDLGELGVMVEGHAYFLYKGYSLAYPTGLHDDGTPMLYRMVGKREFGEVCHPAAFYEPGFKIPARYTQELTFHPGLSDGLPEDGEWRPLPAIDSTQSD